MIYILLIWTVVAASDSQGGQRKVYYDWRPLAEFRTLDDRTKAEALEKCEQAANQLGLKAENYRCVRSR